MCSDVIPTREKIYVTNCFQNGRVEIYVHLLLALDTLDTLTKKEITQKIALQRCVCSTN